MRSAGLPPAATLWRARALSLSKSIELGRDPAGAHARQLKQARRHGKGRVDEGICRHDLPTPVGRKPRRA
jgi:hypothetical protein